MYLQPRRGAFCGGGGLHKPENGRIPEKHALSTGASREAPVDNARLTLGT